MDFSKLSDDQLLQLIQAAMAEAVSRGAAIAYAANREFDAAAEELRVKAEVAARAAAEEAQREAAKIRQQAELQAEKAKAEEERKEQERKWARKAAVIHALLEHELFESEREDPKKPLEVSIWNKGDKRVFLQDYFDGKWQITYYITGNRYESPGTVTGVNIKDPEERQVCERQIASFCEELCKIWGAGFKVSASQTRHVEPDKKDLKRYRKALGTDQPKPQPQPEVTPEAATESQAQPQEETTNV